jgi:hypothetical protein
MDITNDKELWGNTRYDNFRTPRDIRDARYTSDFYDEWARKQIWPNTFAKSYNEEIDNDLKGTMKPLDPSIKDHINPSHYQGIIGNYQYIECMEFILGYEGLKAHLLGQIYKYLMRMGKKDDELQEIRKVVWYARCLEILQREGTIIGKLGELK